MKNLVCLFSLGLALMLGTAALGDGKDCFFKNREGHSLGYAHHSRAQHITTVADCRELCELNAVHYCGKVDANGLDLTFASCTWGKETVEWKNPCPNAAAPKLPRKGSNCYFKNKDGHVLGTEYTSKKRPINRPEICKEFCENSTVHYCHQKDASGLDLNPTQCLWGKEPVVYNDPCAPKK